MCEVRCVVCPTSKTPQKTLDVARVSFSCHSKPVLNVQLPRWEWFCGFCITSSQLTFPEWENTEVFSQTVAVLQPSLHSPNCLNGQFVGLKTGACCLHSNWWGSVTVLGCRGHQRECVLALCFFFFKGWKEVCHRPKVFREWFEYCSRGDAKRRGAVPTPPSASSYCC